MYEKKQGKKSFWYPYIRELDRQRGRGQLAVESPLLWSESELAYLEGSPLKVFHLSPSFLINAEHQFHATDRENIRLFNALYFSKILRLTSGGCDLG